LWVIKHKINTTTSV